METHVVDAEQELLEAIQHSHQALLRLLRLAVLHPRIDAETTADLGYMYDVLAPWPEAPASGAHRTLVRRIA